MTDLYLIALASLRAFTPAIADEIVSRLGSVERFFSLPRAELAAILGSNTRVLDEEVRAKALAAARAEMEFITRTGVRCIPYTSPDYPERLLACDDAPLLLFQFGDTPLNFPSAIAIVGTRHATAYGVDFVNTLCSEWAGSLISPPVIVSGLAYGIDVAAHRSALSSGLTTVAVVAHGLNTIYPSAHRQTAAEMIGKGGALVTEYLSSDQIHRGNFLARNRIVAGMVDAVLVVESAEHGGALVTARLAADYSREVLALPGRVTDRYSRGCNNLISRSAAHLVNSASDIARIMGWKERQEEPADRSSLFPILSPEEELIVGMITSLGDASLNQLIAHINLPSYRLMSVLLDLEFRGIIARMPGGAYRAKL